MCEYQMYSRHFCKIDKIFGKDGLNYIKNIFLFRRKTHFWENSSKMEITYWFNRFHSTLLLPQTIEKNIWKYKLPFHISVYKLFSYLIRTRC